MATIRVPQADDEIRISRDGDIDNPTVYEVHDHLVDVPDDDVDHFRSVIDGAELDGGTSTPTTDPAPKPKKADTPPT